MFRNSYDGDLIYSPDGVIFQVKYAMNSVKQGSPSVGIKSNTHVVLACLKKAPHSELSSYQRKLFKIDEHMGIAISGLAADARVLTKYMRTEALNHRYVYDSLVRPKRLVMKVADKCHKCTQDGGKRPFGVGLLVASYTKENGPQLFQTCPSGNYFEYKGIAIGARSQGAKTYIEKNLSSFPNASLENLIGHALKALEATAADNLELNEDNTSICVIGKNDPRTIFPVEGSSEEVQPFASGVPRSGKFTLYDGEHPTDDPRFIALKRALAKFQSKDDDKSEDGDEMKDE